MTGPRAPGAVPVGLRLGAWLPVRDGDARARGLFSQHYSARHYRDGRRPLKMAGPGEYMMLMTQDCSALFLWKKFLDASGEQGICCAAFRNEGAALSSDLIREADDLAWLRWPGERHYTYVNAKKIASPNPGYCFKM